MDTMEFKAKTVDDALTEATLQLGIPSEQLEYEIIDTGNTGFLGIFNVKPAIIRVSLKKSLVDITKSFCDELFSAMKIETQVAIDYKEEEGVMNIDLSGPDMGPLIGKRGQTLDSLQYLISLYVNKESDSYVRVKLDTENYRERRKVTLEKLAKKISYSVKKSRKAIALEPMNPYERRIIHSALQNDRYVFTRSEGEEPYRKVVIMLKKDRS